MSTKRLLALFAAVTAAMAFSATASNAGGWHHGGGTVTVTQTITVYSVVTPGEFAPPGPQCPALLCLPIGISGTVLQWGHPLSGVTAISTPYDDAACTIPFATNYNKQGLTNGAGIYMIPGGPGLATLGWGPNISWLIENNSTSPGTFWFSVSADGAVSDCHPVTVPGAPPPPVSPTAVPGQTYLSYSRYPISTPGLVLLSQADSLVAAGLSAVGSHGATPCADTTGVNCEGYTVPFAISPALAFLRGVPGPWTMMGGYVLVSNVQGLTYQNEAVDGSGMVESQAQVDAFEAYYGQFGKDYNNNAPNLWKIYG